MTDGGFPPNQMCNETCEIKAVPIFAIREQA